MKTKILITILTVGVFSISTIKAQEKPMKMKQDTMKMDHSKMEMKHDSMTMAKAYACPMHSDEVSDKLGQCSKCGKTLVTKQMNLKNNSLKSKHAKVVETYFCDMHPSEVSDNSGKCPKCGMEFKKIDIKEKDTHKNHRHQ